MTAPVQRGNLSVLDNIFCPLNPESIGYSEPCLLNQSINVHTLFNFYCNFVTMYGNHLRLSDTRPTYHSEANAFDAFQFPCFLCYVAGTLPSQVCLYLLKLQPSSSSSLALIHHLWWLENIDRFSSVLILSLLQPK